MAQQTETNLSEAEAIRQAKDGGAAAFEYLYKLQCGRVYRVCLRMVGNPAENAGRGLLWFKRKEQQLLCARLAQMFS